MTPIDYGNDLRESLSQAAPDGINAVLDCVGSGYVDLSIELGVDPGRVNTIIDFAAAAKHEGVYTDGSSAGEDAGTLADVASLVAAGEVQVPITAVYDWTTYAWHTLGWQRAIPAVRSCFGSQHLMRKGCESP